ncbi:MAG: FG-GAP repeat domain-containing protein, partial [Rubrobacter sp.]
AQYGVLEPFSRGRASTFMDANGDAYPDLLTVNQSDRPDGLPSPTRLFVNQEGRAFRPAPELGLEHESEGGAAIPGDLDGDGREDLLVDTNSSGKRASDLRVYRNERGGGFTEVAEEVGLGHSVVDATLAEVNGDGQPDVVEVTSDKLRVLHNDNGTFSVAYSTGLSYGRAVATGDVNGDGLSDVYAMRGKSSKRNAPDRVFINGGSGEDFSRLSSVPSTSEGEAESVWPIDYDENGLTDFLVLNGLNARGGPVQLIAFYRDDS